MKAVENLTDPVLGLYWIYQLTSVRHKLQPALDWGMTPPQWPFDRCPISPLSVRFRCGFAPLWLIAFPRVTRSPVGIAGCPFAPLTVVVACIYCTGAKDLYLDPAQFNDISHLCPLPAAAHCFSSPIRRAKERWVRKTRPRHWRSGHAPAAADSVTLAAGNLKKLAKAWRGLPVARSTATAICAARTRSVLILKYIIGVITYLIVE